MKTLNMGVVGCGFMGKAHTFAYKTIPLYYENLPIQIRLAGVCAAHLERADAFAAAHGYSFGTDNPQVLFDHPEIDAVSICSPTGLHYNHVLAALEAGKHVLCDKPLATTAQEAQALDMAAKRAGVTAQVSFQCRCYTPAMRAKELVMQGRLGRILSFRIAYLHAGAVDPCKPMSWRFDPVGGGVLFDLGSHALDMAQFLMGDFKSVSAVLERIYAQRPNGQGVMAPVETDDGVILMAQMANGAMGTVEASKIATGSEDELRFEIHGDQGAISYNSKDLSHLYFYDNTQKEGPLGANRGWTALECSHRYPAPGGGFPGGKFAPGFLRGHVHSIYNFVQSVAKNAPGSPSFAEAAYIQHVMDRVKLSHETRAWVDI